MKRYSRTPKKRVYKKTRGTITTVVKSSAGTKTTVWKPKKRKTTRRKRY